MVWIRRNGNYTARIDIKGRQFNAQAYESYCIRKGFKTIFKKG